MTLPMVNEACHHVRTLRLEITYVSFFFRSYLAPCVLGSSVSSRSAPAIANGETFESTVQEEETRPREEGATIFETIPCKRIDSENSLSNMSGNNDICSNKNNNYNSSICVVCYKNVDIYSIGMCEHPVCYECSTRMRVLCRQNECPICRQDLPKVVFTREIKPFRSLTGTNLLDTRYDIYFISLYIQEKFTKLLVNTCSICKEKPIFSSFSSLKDHMRQHHELYYCDLCVENLKVR